MHEKMHFIAFIAKNNFSMAIKRVLWTNKRVLRIKKGVREHFGVCLGGKGAHMVGTTQGAPGAPSYTTGPYFTFF